MGFRTIAQIPFLNVSEAKVIKMHEHNQSIISLGMITTQDNSTEESIEFCDNRLARFVAVKGKCEVSKQQLLFEDVVCHRFIPKEQGGTDEYKNLRIVHKDVAQLIYETDVNTIHRLIEKTGCKESTKLTKLNFFTKLPRKRLVSWKVAFPKSEISIRNMRNFFRKRKMHMPSIE